VGEASNMTDGRVDLVVRGGLVVTPSGTIDASIAIRGEKIVAVGADDLMPPSERSIDASGKCVLPGAIDCHVHLGGNDDYRTGSVAAARAGITTLIPFGEYRLDDRETLPQAIRRLNDEVERNSVADVAWHFILASEPYIVEGIPEAFALGVRSYKMFMTYKKRKDRMCPDSFIYRVMEIVAAHRGIVQLHCENGEVNDYLEEKFIAEGRVRPQDFPAACPDWSEAESVFRGITMGVAANCPTYVVHLSTRQGLEYIRDAQRHGHAVWTETCPQYLLLSDAMMEKWGPFAKIGPPLRSSDGAHQKALWHGLEQGTISCIGSDHAPPRRALKEQGWDNVFYATNGTRIPFGAPGIETVVPLVYSEGVVKRGLPLEWMARVMAGNPARIFGLYPRKGAIQPGSDADLLLIDPRTKRSIRAADHKSTAGYTLFEGWEVTGWPWMTLLRGKVLLDRGELALAPGSGRYIPAGRPQPPDTSRAMIGGDAFRSTP
jgi:dihydropyrimidinase